MRKPKIFIMGEVFDMNTLTTAELTKKLQTKINTYGFHDPCVVDVWDDHDLGNNFSDEYSIYIGVKRGYGIGRWLYMRFDEEGYMIEGDANVITGNEHDYTVKKKWPVSEFLKDFSGQYSVNISSFTDTYKGICEEEGADIPEDTEYVQSENGFFEWIMTYPQPLP